MDTALAGSLMKLTVGGLSVDASFFEGDPVLELMGGFLAVEVCLESEWAGLDSRCFESIESSFLEMPLVETEIARSTRY
jgi:hypothetical protein